jgi:predicted transcriptional regulator
MQTPDYMYYNDLIADWQRHYVESCIPKQYPLVDDDLEIFGALDLWKSATAVPSQKLSTALANNNELSPVAVDDSIKDITRQFVVNEQFFAPVLDGRRMMGIISAIDLLRYYMWSESEPGTNSTDSFLTLDSSLPDEKDVTFRVHIPASALNGMGHLENDLLLSAAESHLRQLGMINYKVTNGTFFTLKPLSYTENLQLESRIQSSTPESAVMELELYDEKDSYAKMVITASLNDGKDE